MGNWCCLNDVEYDRELAVQKVPCPVCGAAKGRRCDWPQAKTGGGPATSHTGRYRLAARAGLVPPLPGVAHV